jgi:hypothetical protein
MYRNRVTIKAAADNFGERFRATRRGSTREQDLEFAARPLGSAAAGGPLKPPPGSRHTVSYRGRRADGLGIRQRISQ